MSSLGGPVLRLIIAPAAPAAIAGFELSDTDVVGAIGVGWCVFALCIVSIHAWGAIRLERARRGLRARSGRRSRAKR